MRAILLVDKGPETRKSVVDLFFQLNRYNIIQASNGSETFSKCQNQEFDIIISDFQVPSTVEDLIIIATSNKLNFNLDVEVVNPFIDAVIETLKNDCGAQKIEHDRPQNVFQDIKVDVVGTIAVVSKYYTGKISICFKEKTFLNVASKFKDEKISKLTEEARDIAAKFINKIYDHAKDIIHKKQFELEKAIPGVIEPKEFHIKNNSKSRNIGVRFMTDLGDFTFVINVQKVEI